ncbi:MAG: YggT family protein [Firmicutes bacterium]|nr:YggT family protein [Bacillota bacterium]
MILARVFMTWIPNIDYYHPLVRFIYDWTEPVLAPFRRMLPPLGGFDLSPVLVFAVLEFIRGAILRAPLIL